VAEKEMSQLLYAQQKRRRSLPPRRRAGLGFYSESFDTEKLFDGLYYGDFDYGGYYGNGGGGGYYDGYDFSDPGLTPDTPLGGDWSFDGYGWLDSTTGLYVDEFGGVYDTWGVGSNQDFTPDTTDEFGNPLIRFSTDDYGQPDWEQISQTWGTASWDSSYEDVAVDHSTGTVDLSALQQTLDWWNAIADDPAPEPVTLPPVTYDAGYILSVPSTTLASDPNAPPALKKPSTWDKIKQAVAPQIQKAAQAAASGAVAPGAKPQSVKPPTTKPNAQGQCAPGYVLNPQTKQCVLLSPKPPANSFWQTLTNNPLYLLGGAILLVLLAKR
jgi:hypothetical protein